MINIEMIKKLLQASKTTRIHTIYKSINSKKKHTPIKQRWTESLRHGIATDTKYLKTTRDKLIRWLNKMKSKRKNIMSSRYIICAQRLRELTKTPISAFFFDQFQTAQTKIRQSGSIFFVRSTQSHLHAAQTISLCTWTIMSGLFSQIYMKLHRIWQDDSQGESKAKLQSATIALIIFNQLKIKIEQFITQNTNLLALNQAQHLVNEITAAEDTQYAHNKKLCPQKHSVEFFQKMHEMLQGILLACTKLYSNIYMLSQYGMLSSARNLGFLAAVIGVQLILAIAKHQCLEGHRTTNTRSNITAVNQRSIFTGDSKTALASVNTLFSWFRAIREEVNAKIFDSHNTIIKIEGIFQTIEQWIEKNLIYLSILFISTEPKFNLPFSATGKMTLGAFMQATQCYAQITKHIRKGLDLEKKFQETQNVFGFIDRSLKKLGTEGTETLQKKAAPSLTWTKNIQLNTGLGFLQTALYHFSRKIIHTLCRNLIIQNLLSAPLLVCCIQLSLQLLRKMRSSSKNQHLQAILSEDQLHLTTLTTLVSNMVPAHLVSSCLLAYISTPWALLFTALINITSRTVIHHFLQKGFILPQPQAYNLSRSSVNSNSLESKDGDTAEHFILRKGEKIQRRQDGATNWSITANTEISFQPGKITGIYGKEGAGKSSLCSAPLNKGSSTYTFGSCKPVDPDKYFFFPQTSKSLRLDQTAAPTTKMRKELFDNQQLTQLQLMFYNRVMYCESSAPNPVQEERNRRIHSSWGAIERDLRHFYTQCKLNDIDGRLRAHQLSLSGGQGQIITAGIYYAMIKLWQRMDEKTCRTIILDEFTNETSTDISRQCTAILKEAIKGTLTSVVCITHSNCPETLELFDEVINVDSKDNNTSTATQLTMIPNFRTIANEEMDPRHEEALLLRNTFDLKQQNKVKLARGQSCTSFKNRTPPPTPYRNCTQTSPSMG